MKKTKVIIPALGLLLLSTAASVTGTVAWFAANASVTASGMQLKAKAEQGILISTQTAASPSSAWGASATALNSGSGVAVFPTSTANASTWYHNKGVDIEHSTAAGAYETLSITETSGVGYDASDNAYYLHNTFYVKASSDTAFTAPLIVNQVTGTGSSQSVDLDKALRVLVKQGSNVAIFAPFNGTAAELTYSVHGDTEITAINATVEKENHQLNNALSYPEITNAVPVAIDVFIYFEGEDVNCKSENITNTLDALSITLVFGTQNI